MAKLRFLPKREQIDRNGILTEKAAIVFVPRELCIEKASLVLNEAQAPSEDFVGRWRKGVDPRTQRPMDTEDGVYTMFFKDTVEEVELSEQDLAACLL